MKSIRSIASEVGMHPQASARLARVETQGVLGLGFRWGGGRTGAEGLAVAAHGVAGTDSAFGVAVAVAGAQSLVAVEAPVVTPLAPGDQLELPAGPGAPSALPAAPAAPAAVALALPAVKPNLIVLSEAVLPFGHDRAYLAPAAVANVRRLAKDLQAHYPSDCVRNVSTTLRQKAA